MMATLPQLHRRALHLLYGLEMELSLRTVNFQASTLAKRSWKQWQQLVASKKIQPEDDVLGVGPARQAEQDWAVGYFGSMSEPKLSRMVYSMTEPDPRFNTNGGRSMRLIDPQTKRVSWLEEKHKGYWDTIDPDFYPKMEKAHLAFNSREARRVRFPWL